MKSVKKTSITIETERVFVLSRKLSLAWCDACDTEVSVIRLEEAAKLSGISLTALCRQIEEAKLHVKEDAEGNLLICFDSLLHQQKPQQ